MAVRLQIVGGGRMGSALLGGLIAGRWASAKELAVVEAVPRRRDELATEVPGVAVLEEPQRCDGTVIAVKPGDVADAVSAAVEAGTERLLSIAAGVTIATLEAACVRPLPVVRAMPNTPSLVGHGSAAIAGGTVATDDDLDWAESILAAVGVVVRVGEPLLDAVTGLSGSGPAYVFLVAEALTEAGVLEGLPRDVAATLAAHTVAGAGRLMVDTEDGPEALRAAVTSPGGTTAAGLRALEDRGVRAALMAAVTAASARSRALGR